MLAGLTIVTVMYAAGISLFLVLLNTSYGWEETAEKVLFILAVYDIL